MKNYDAISIQYFNKKRISLSKMALFRMCMDFTQQILQQILIPRSQEYSIRAKNKSGAALLSMVRRCSVMVRRCSDGAALLSHGAALFSMVWRCSVWCGVAQLMVRRCSVGSASACCKAGPSSILGSAPQGGFFPLSLQSDEEMEKGPGECATDKWIV
jgi:hypothetical protein